MWLESKNPWLIMWIILSPFLTIETSAIIYNWQDTYASMRNVYYKNGDGFLLVYSITDSSSLEDVKERFQSLLTQRVIHRFFPDDPVKKTLIKINLFYLSTNEA